MELYEQFGEFDSAEEINEAAKAQLEEGDTEAIFKIAEENGIDKEDAQDFIDGVEPTLCTVLTAATGKIDIEEKYLGLKEAEHDYAETIRRECFNDPEFALAVRKKGKSLAKALGLILKKAWSIKHDLHHDIIEAAGINGRVQSGSPGARTVIHITREYYLGGEQDEAN